MASPATASSGRLVDIGGTHLFVVLRGPAEAPPLLVLHGGPGLDHHEFADYLDPLTDSYRLLLVDQRAQGRSDRDVPDETLTLEQMADDVSRLAASLGLTGYAVLGHSYGSFVALQHACDAPHAAIATIVSGGVPADRWLSDVAGRLAAFEPAELREQVAASWAKEAEVGTAEEFAQLMHEQQPWHFADPYDPRIGDFERRSAEMIYAPHVLRVLSRNNYGAIALEDRLASIPQPLLALGGRYDRTCPPEASEFIAAGAPHGQCHIFERAGHMTYVEQQQEYLYVLRDFLDRAFAAGPHAGGPTRAGGPPPAGA